jgi:hemolysin D
MRQPFFPPRSSWSRRRPWPIGRAMVMGIILLFCSALALASLEKVDVVATAPGKIIVNGRTKVIQPAETGLVRAIHVHDGSTVKSGDALRTRSNHQCGRTGPR